MFVSPEMYALWYWPPITYIYSEKSLIKRVRSFFKTERVYRESQSNTFYYEK